jgi:hypothetical protein
MQHMELCFFAASAAFTGPRCFLMSHAHGFIDVLYSRGMINTFEQIHALAPRLMQALRDDDFSPARFEYPRRLQAAMIKDDDRMVFNSFRAFTTALRSHPAGSLGAPKEPFPINPCGTGEAQGMARRWRTPQ